MEPPPWGNARWWAWDGPDQPGQNAAGEAAAQPGQNAAGGRRARRDGSTVWWGGMTGQYLGGVNVPWFYGPGAAQPYPAAENAPPPAQGAQAAAGPPPPVAEQAGNLQNGEVCQFPRADIFPGNVVKFSCKRCETQLVREDHRLDRGHGWHSFREGINIYTDNQETLQSFHNRVTWSPCFCLYCRSWIGYTVRTYYGNEEHLNIHPGAHILFNDRIIHVPVLNGDAYVEGLLSQVLVRPMIELNVLV